MTLLMEMVGWIGAVLVLTAYALVSAKRLPPQGLLYQAMNIGGSLLLASYAFWHGALASVAVNVIWLLIGTLTVIRIRRAP